MESNTTIAEFLKSYKQAATKAARQKICKECMKRTYVPVMEKFAALLGIFYEVNQKINGFRNFNSFAYHIAFVTTTIGLYTDLIMKDETMTTPDAYDALKESGAMDELLLMIGESELKEWERISDFIEEDSRENENSIPAILSTQMERLIAAMPALNTPEQKEVVDQVVQKIAEAIPAKEQ